MKLQPVTEIEWKALDHYLVLSFQHLIESFDLIMSVTLLKGSTSTFPCSHDGWLKPDLLPSWLKLVENKENHEKKNFSAFCSKKHRTVILMRKETEIWVLQLSQISTWMYFPDHKVKVPKEDNGILTKLKRLILELKEV